MGHSAQSYILTDIRLCCSVGSFRQQKTMQTRERPCCTRATLCLSPVQAPQHLSPLVNWVQQVKLADLEDLLSPFRKLLADGLRSTMNKVDAFHQLPELQRLQVLWLDYVVPLVMDSEANTPASNAAMLAAVQQDLSLCMAEVAKEHVRQLKRELAQQVSFACRLPHSCCKAQWFICIAYTAASPSCKHGLCSQSQAKPDFCLHLAAWPLCSPQPAPAAGICVL